MVLKLLYSDLDFNYWTKYLFGQVPTQVPMYSIPPHAFILHKQFNLYLLKLLIYNWIYAYITYKFYCWNT